MTKNAAIYAGVLLLFGLAIYAILWSGSQLLPVATAPAAAATHPPTAGGTLPENLRHPLSVLLLQIVVVLAAARGMGSLARRIGQPAVIGEMLAGILLGPSLFGTLTPAVSAFVFPPASLGTLQMLSQVGVILFLFVVGMQVDSGSLRRKAHAAIVVSHTGILFPFFLGAALALGLFRSLAPAGVPFTAFALFMGVAMSITAFPVLVRILDERKLTGTPLGNIAIACAAVDDVTAWCLLAAVVAVARADGLLAALPTVGLALLFIVGMLFLVGPRSRRLFGDAPIAEERAHALVAGVLTFVFASAWLTESIGIHALFGAFLAGVALPANPSLRALLRTRIETFTSVCLLPLFFAFTGLRTQVGLLGDAQDWLVCAGIIGVAVAGKLGGSLVAARLTGMTWRDSFALGALMNTRGLMELIALNIGFDLGILSPRIFAMLVLMALVTTLMTGPLLTLAAARPQPGEAPLVTGD